MRPGASIVKLPVVVLLIATMLAMAFAAPCDTGADRGGPRQARLVGAPAKADLAIGLHITEPLKLGATAKPAPAVTHFPFTTINLSAPALVRTALQTARPARPELPRSPWVGVVELRI